MKRSIVCALVACAAVARADSNVYWRQGVGEVVARPYLLTMTFLLQRTGGDPSHTAAALERASAELGKRLQAAAPAATLRMRNLTVYDLPLDRQAREPRQQVTVDGVVDVPLPPDADWWARARLVLAIDAAGRRFTDEQGRQGTTARVDRPVAVVKAPESLRGDLIKAWLDRARGFSSAAGQPPLQLVECSPPGRVTQAPLTLEEVAIQLPQSCRLDLPRR